MFIITDHNNVIIRKYFETKISAEQYRLQYIADHMPYLIPRKIEKSNTYLLEDESGQKYNYSRYVTVFEHVMKLIKGKHTTHDCRHTCATLLDNGGANPVSKRRILGHVDGDIDDRVYTHKDLRQLRRAIQCIK